MELNLMRGIRNYLLTCRYVNAISLESAQQNGIQPPIVGKADILLFANFDYPSLTVKGTIYDWLMP
jgi:hypothetical protein